MKIIIKENPRTLGQAAGDDAAFLIKEAIRTKGAANLILATGASQFETLNQLIKHDIDWSRVTMFHLDEYIDLPETARASFRKYLKERFLQKVAPLAQAVLIDGNADPATECDRIGQLISNHPIDVALVGIGENGHLAFNDPPADFKTTDPYIVVELDKPCREQQLAEGWFDTLAEVPEKAISMSVQQIMKSKNIICSVPDSRKAEAVKNTIEQEISNLYPASILRVHHACTFYLDTASAALIKAQDSVVY